MRKRQPKSPIKAVPAIPKEFQFPGVRKSRPPKGLRIKSNLYVKSERALRLRDFKTQRLMRRVKNALPYLTDGDIPAVRGWASLEVMAQQVYAILRNVGPVNEKGEPRRLLSEFRSLRLAQLAFERELGMTPASRMAIKADRTNAAIDVAGLLNGTDDSEDTPSKGDDASTDKAEEVVDSDAG
jgi:hypothetical protein